jgi:soluble P-type ATPase
MLEINIPGDRILQLAYLVSDYNGTLACDGQLIEGLGALIQEVSRFLEIHIVTADTFGVAEKNLQGLPVRLTVLSLGDQAEQKAQYVRELGAGRTVTLGNGRNDRLMLKEAGLGICVMESEGVSASSLLVSDVACRSAHEALQVLLNPKRLTATLRV